MGSLVTVQAQRAFGIYTAQGHYLQTDGDAQCSAPNQLNNVLTCM